MRIVAGKWAGRDLVSPSGRVRPTTEELRALWLDMLKTEFAADAEGRSRPPAARASRSALELEGARCLDLFAGTGALGLEALSRGARSCDFVENGPSAIHALKANVAALHARACSRIFDRDAIPFVERITQVAYDIAFADPPYGSRKLDRIIKRWLEQPFARVLSVEHAPDHKLPARGRSRRLGDSVVTILRTSSRNCV